MAQSGSCLCGASSFTADPEPHADVCHCAMCRSWSGGMFIAVACGPSLRFDDGAPIGVYGSSDWGERVFCKECGASMVWRTKDGQMQMASIQCFDDPGQFEITSQIFIDSKPGNYALANETKCMTGEEVFAMFATDQEGH